MTRLTSSPVGRDTRILIGLIVLALLGLIFWVWPRSGPELTGSALAEACRSEVTKQWGEVDLWRRTEVGVESVNDAGTRVWINEAVRHPNDPSTIKSALVTCSPQASGVSVALN